MNSSILNKNKSVINTQTFVVKNNLKYIRSGGIMIVKSKTSSLNLRRPRVKYSFIKANQKLDKLKSPKPQDSPGIESNQFRELKQSLECAKSYHSNLLPNDLLSPLKYMSRSNIYNGEHIHTLKKFFPYPLIRSNI